MFVRGLKSTVTVRRNGSFALLARRRFSATATLSRRRWPAGCRPSSCGCSWPVCWGAWPPPRSSSACVPRSPRRTGPSTSLFSPSVSRRPSPLAMRNISVTIIVLTIIAEMAFFQVVLCLGLVYSENVLLKAQTGMLLSSCLRMLPSLIYNECRISVSGHFYARRCKQASI